MQPHAVEPGARLVDRYRLERQLGEAQGVYWRAHDELLDRPVGILLVPAGTAPSERVLAAARRAAAMTDPRFLRVLDASERDGVVYVVNEWVQAVSLLDLLADGPLPAAEARELLGQVAEGLAAAHQAGLAHLGLQPRHVLRTQHGQVKIIGLAVEAAAHGADAAGLPDPDAAARRDARGAAQVGYAALTARWPGRETTGVPVAPYDGSAPCSPRQVRAGVPPDLDQLLARALGLPGAHGGPLEHPAELAAAVHRSQTGTRAAGSGLSTTSPTDSYPPGRLPPYDDAGRRRPPRGAVLAWAAGLLVLLVGLGLAGSQLLLSLGERGASPAPGQQGSPTPSQSDAPTGRPLRIVAVRSFDPEGTGAENEDRAGLAVDGDRATAWTTKTYFDQFGDTGLKHGVGLVLDLGSVQTVSSVTVRTEDGGTGLALRAATQPATRLSGFAPVAPAQSDVDGPGTFRPTQPLRTRYLLVWLTSLPAVGSGFRGSISEITVRG